MTLHACTRCGGTLTDAFRFCPACGLSNDDDDGWLLETKPALTFPVVEPRRRTRAARQRPRIKVASIVAPPRRVADRVLAFMHRLMERFDRGVRQCARGLGETARLLVELVLVSAGSARDALRSMVLLRRLHARRAAVIYSSGCAALSGDDRGVQHARAELRMLDDLITAAAAQTLPPDRVRAGL
jgi:hypothetical protein